MEPETTTPQERRWKRIFPIFASLFLGGWLLAAVLGPLAQGLGGPALRLAVAVESDRSGGSATARRIPGTVNILQTGRLEARDDWGEPIAYRQVFSSLGGVSPPRVYYSFGPNRNDDEAAADDVVPSAATWVLAAWLQHSFFVVGGLFASLSLWFLLLLCAVQSSSTRGELALAALIAIPPAAGTGSTFVVLAQPWSAQLASVQWTALSIHWIPLAFASAALISYLATLAIRLRLITLGKVPPPLTPAADPEPSP